MSDLIVKANALIQASFNFSLAEQRLILLAIVEARLAIEDIDDKTLLSIHASSYSKHFNTDSKTAYKVLKSAGDTLKNKTFSFMGESPMTGKPLKFEDKWLNRIAYEEHSGYLHLRFSEAVIPLIIDLGTKFTSYEIQKIVKLTSSYAIRLYELIMQWKTQSKTQKFTIDDLRAMLGVEPEQYKELYNLKARVIDVAIEQINKHTDVKVSYEQHKQGRNVVAVTFKFKFKDKPKEVLIKEDKPFKMTAKQCSFYSKLLASLPELGSKAPIGASVDSYANMIANDLADPTKLIKYTKHLSKLGFKQQ